MAYFFRFWSQVIRTAVYVIRHRRIETRRAYSLLDAVEKSYGGQFAAPTRRKIAVSYGIYTPMICDAFTLLHGRRTSLAEKERFIHYFICSSLFDDFTDYVAFPEAELFALSFDPEHFVPRNFDESVFRDSHLFLRGFVHERVVYDALTERLFQAQWDSKKQAPGGGLSREALQEITFRKGGLSVLLCSFYLDLSPTPAERDCWYRIGTIIQLTNDLFDIYKDLGEHMDTLPVRITDAHAFRAFFEEQITGMQAAIRRLDVSSEAFRLAMAGIYAFGLIALDQLEALQGEAFELPPLETLTRKQLVIDMEKRTNLVKWLKYTYHNAR